MELVSHVDATRPLIDCPQKNMTHSRNNLSIGAIRQSNLICNLIAQREKIKKMKGQNLETVTFLVSDWLTFNFD